MENPDITYRDSLAQDHVGEEEKYTLVLANPPFAGSLDYESCAKDLQQVVKTKKRPDFRGDSTVQGLDKVLRCTGKVIR